MNARAGLQHAAYFADGAVDVRRVMQDAMRVDEVDRRIIERQVLRARIHRRSVQSPYAQIAPRQQRTHRCEIDSDVSRAALSELRSIGSHAAADLDDALAANVIELQKLADVRLALIAVTLIVEKELARHDRRLDGLRAARILVPEFLDLLYLDHGGLSHAVAPGEIATARFRSCTARAFASAIERCAPTRTPSITQKSPPPPQCLRSDLRFAESCRRRRSRALFAALAK